MADDGPKRSQRYALWTVLAAAVLVPVAEQFAFVVSSLLVGSYLFNALGSNAANTASLAIAVLATALAFWSVWLIVLRRLSIPRDYCRRFLPIVAAHAYYVVVWAVFIGLSGYSLASGLWGTFDILTLPFVVLDLALYLKTAMDLLPCLLAIHMLFSLAAVQWSARKQPGPKPPVKSLAWPAAAVAAMAVLVGFQLFQHARIYPDFDNAAQTVAGEVDLFEYRPFAPDNMLAELEDPQLEIAHDYPKMDGATAAYPVYAAVAQALYKGLDSQTVEGYVACSRTDDAYANLIAGRTDVFFGAQPSEQQLEAARQAGVELELTPLGHEAFVFIVNSGNPVDSLTVEQIQGIYQKRIVNWRELGGNDEAIMAFQRPEGSGSQTIMLAKVMQGQPIAEPLRSETVGFMGGTVDEVAEYRNLGSAIGYSFRYFVTGMKASRDVKLLAIDGIEPSVANIADGSYPLAIDFYAVTAGTDNPNVQPLLEWLTSTQGQSFIAQCGYVPLRKR